MSTEQSVEGISLVDFTNELVALLVNALEANPDLRPKIDVLCDPELYQNMVNLTHVEYGIDAAELVLPDPQHGELQALLQRAAHDDSYLKMRDWNHFRSGSIAVVLREALGYDPDAEMGDEHARMRCNESIQPFMI
jgi:hypothetical protein